MNKIKVIVAAGALAFVGIIAIQIYLLRQAFDYEEKKLNIARNLLPEADKVFGGLKDPRILDIFTPLTIRDYVNCPEGSCYGLLRSSRQLLKVASLSNIPLSGLYLAGQNVTAPGVLGTIMGSFNAVSKIVGAKRLAEELPLMRKQVFNDRKLL